MNEKSDRLLARSEKALEEGAANMWRNTLADTVMIMLAAEERITHDTLLSRLETQMGDSDSKYYRAQCRGALNVLHGRSPQD